MTVRPRSVTENSWRRLCCVYVNIPQKSCRIWVLATIMLLFESTFPVIKACIKYARKFCQRLNLRTWKRQVLQMIFQLSEVVSAPCTIKNTAWFTSKSSCTFKLQMYTWQKHTVNSIWKKRNFKVLKQCFLTFRLTSMLCDTFTNGFSNSSQINELESSFPICYGV